MATRPPGNGLGQQRRARSVVFLLPDAQRGGTEGQVLRLAEGLARRGWDVAVWVLRGEGPITDELAFQRLPWRTFGMHPGVHTRAAGLARFVWALARVRPTVVYALLPPCVLLGLTFTRICSPRTARIAGVRGFTPDRGALAERLIGMALRTSAAVIVNAEHLATETVNRFRVDRDRVHVIPNGIDVPDVMADPMHQPPTAVVVANLLAYKGHATMLQALTLVPANLTVRLCGTGPEESALRKQVSSLGLSGRVIFVDPPADIGRELRGAQFAIHPSLTEGLSNAVLEELAHGLPVIATAVGGTPTLVTDGLNGLLVPPGEPGPLAQAITALCESPDVRAGMASHARNSVARFAWNHSIDRHEHILIVVLLPTPKGRGSTAAEQSA